MQFSDEITFAGDYRLGEVILHTINGEQIDIKNILIELNVFESINKNSLYGNLIIRDASNLIYNKSICGQEKLSFVLHTPGSNDSNRINFKDFNARVYKISDINRTLTREQTFRLHFTTEESITNTRTRLSRAVEGTPSDLVKTLLRSITKKNLFIEDTVSIHKFVIPNLRPFDFIRMLKKRSESKYDNNTGYLFYENHRGYNFRSFSSLTHKNNEPRKPVETYVDTTPARNDSDPAFRDITTDMRAIRKYTILHRNDYLSNVTTGMLGSTHYSHDIFTKTYTKTETNYFEEFDKRKHADEQYSFSPLYSRVLKENLTGNTVADFPKSKIILSPRARNLHSQTVNDPRSYDNRIVNTLQKYLETQLNFDAIRLKLEVAGNTYISVGDVIEVLLPNLEPVETKSDENYDQHLSGYWIITDIRHIVDLRDHQMVLECVRDTYHSGLFAINSTIGDFNTQSQKIISINEDDV